MAEQVKGSEAELNELLAEYWKDLWQSVAFEGGTIISCLRRIHDNILKIWNFNDPQRVSDKVFRFSSSHSDVDSRSLAAPSFYPK